MPGSKCRTLSLPHSHSLEQDLTSPPLDSPGQRHVMLIGTSFPSSSDPEAGQEF